MPPVQIACRHGFWEAAVSLVNEGSDIYKRSDHGEWVTIIELSFLANLT